MTESAADAMFNVGFWPNSLGRSDRWSSDDNPALILLIWCRGVPSSTLNALANTLKIKNNNSTLLVLRLQYIIHVEKYAKTWLLMSLAPYVPRPSAATVLIQDIVFLSFIGRYFNSLRHISCKKWQKMNIWFLVFAQVISEEYCNYRADHPGLAPSQWETSFQSNTVSHWLGANLESNLQLCMHIVLLATQIARFVGPTWGPPGSCRPQMGLMLTPWTLLYGYVPGSGSHIYPQGWF